MSGAGGAAQRAGCRDDDEEREPPARRPRTRRAGAMPEVRSATVAACRLHVAAAGADARAPRRRRSRSSWTASERRERPAGDGGGGGERQPRHVRREPRAHRQHRLRDDATAASSRPCTAPASGPVVGMRAGRRRRPNAVMSSGAGQREPEPGGERAGPARPAACRRRRRAGC